jgi:hypothetical protein
MVLQLSVNDFTKKHKKIIAHPADFMYMRLEKRLLLRLYGRSKKPPPTRSFFKNRPGAPGRLKADQFL